MLISTLLGGVAIAFGLGAAAVVRRVPGDHILVLRHRANGHVRAIGPGLHMVVPGIEHVSRTLYVAGTSVPVDGLARGDARYRAVVYYQVLELERAGAMLDRVEQALQDETRRQFAAVDSALPANPQPLKQALNAIFRQRGLLVARVELAAAA